MSLTACVYDDGFGQYNSGVSSYGVDEYCDPYNEYNAYYGCDIEYGFANFGYNGGWHQEYYYPGFGLFIFDNAGRRYRMNDYYLGYWGRKRQQYFQSRFSDRRYSGRRLRSFPRRGRIERGDRERISRRAERRDNESDESFKDRQARREARRDRRNQRNEVEDNSQRGDRRDRRNERRQNRRSDNDNANPPQNSQKQNRPSRQNNNQARRGNNSENNKRTTPRSQRIKQNQNNQPNSIQYQVREPHNSIPQDD